VWVDGKLAGEKMEFERQTVTVPIAAGIGKRTINVLIEAEKSDVPAGLGGAVTVE